MDDTPKRQLSQIGFAFHPAPRHSMDVDSRSDDKADKLSDMTVCLDLCTRKRCNPKLRETLAGVPCPDATLSAPELRDTLAEAVNNGRISKKARERLQREFKDLYGGRDFPGVPDSVDD